LIVYTSTSTDYVEDGMSAILTQIDENGKFYVISCASKQLIKKKKNYSPGKGCLGIGHGILPRTLERQKI
jgi:hypothetical protein